MCYGCVPEDGRSSRPDVVEDDARNSFNAQIALIDDVLAARAKETALGEVNGPKTSSLLNVVKLFLIRETRSYS